VTIQRIGFVLCEDADPFQLRVDAIRECEVDDPINSSERNCRLCSMLRQRVQTLALTAGKDDRQRVLNDRACSGSWSFQGSVTYRALAISFLSESLSDIRRRNF